MPTVGEQLRTAREARKLRIQEVAEATNMRTDHILALEEGNYAPFPAPVYIRGSIRTYAKLLKLDVMQIMGDLDAEMNHEVHAGDSSGTHRRHRGIVDFLAYQLARFGWKRSLILLAILVVLLLILLIRGADSGKPAPNPLADLPPPAYQPARGADNGFLPLPSTNR